MRRPSLFALGLAWLAACGRGGETANPTGAPTLNASVTRVAPVMQVLLQKIVDAPATERWQGVRRFELHTLINGAPQDLEYQERVSADGTGRFDIEPLDLLQPVLSAQAEAEFLLLLDMREGMLFHHRDRVIRDVGLFLQNYQVSDAGTLHQIAGRDCALLTVQGNAASTTWSLWIDVATGLVLREEERDSQGTLLLRLDYESFTQSFDDASVAWHASSVQSSVIDLSSAQQALGHAPAMPAALPAGYSLFRFEHVVSPGDNRDWARITYSDGFEELFFLDGGQGAQQTIVTGTVVDADVARVSTFGPWTFVEAQISTRPMMAIGRADQTALLQLIESAQP